MKALPPAARFCALIFLWFVAGALPVQAQFPQLLNFQGRVAVDGTNFDQPGAFKFALVNGNSTIPYWSNDGTSTSVNTGAGTVVSEPVSAVPVPVVKGLYSVQLGDTSLQNMTAPLPVSVFSNPDVRLRIWFNDGTHGFQVLAPDQRLVATGYAFMAGSVADGTITSPKLTPDLTLPGNVTIGSTLTLPQTTSSTTGILNLATTPFLHSFGAANVFLGGETGNFTMSGQENTIVGYVSFAANTTGIRNSALGHETLVHNLSGSTNTAVGQTALYNNTTGSNGVALGAEALFSNTGGNNNTSVGYEALYYNAGGNSNTAVGEQALMSNVGGGSNIAIGQGAGKLINGSSNIAIGNAGAAGESNTIRIGTSQNTTYIAGISGQTAPSGAPVLVAANGRLGTTTSSQRFKRDIEDMAEGSDAVLSLRPVRFKYKTDIDPDGIPQFGLIAEEVEKVEPRLILKDAEGKPLTVRYEAVNAMLLNEFLKEHRRMQTLDQRVKELEQKLQAVADRLPPPPVKTTPAEQQ